MQKIVFAFLMGLVLSGAAHPSIAQQPQEPQQQVLEEVIVIGSRIKRGSSQFDSFSTITSVDRAEIDASGILTGQFLIQQLPSNSGSENQESLLSQNTAVGTANVNLRGLGIGSTLVLVNGQRQTKSAAVTQTGDAFVDINSLVPMIMVQNVEFMTDGGAALYGSDAVAGVVNYRTRDDFDGFGIQIDLQETSRDDDHSDRQISGIWGAQTEKSGVVVGVSHFERVGILREDRDSFAKPILVPFSNPPNFFLAEPSPTIPDAVVGASNADPLCGEATATQLVSISPAGATSCLFDANASGGLIADEQRDQVYVVASHDLSEKLRLRAEFGWSRNESEIGWNRSVPALELMPVSADHPGNPWQADGLVQFSPRGWGFDPLGVDRLEGAADHTTRRITLGLEGQIGASSWSYNIDYTSSEADLVDSQPDSSKSRTKLALAGFGGANCDVLNGTAGEGNCLYYNPFGTAITAEPGSPEFNSPEVMDFIMSSNIGRSSTELETYQATVAGELFDMPAGPVGVVVGFQRREESRMRDNSKVANLGDLNFFIGDPDGEADRTIDAGFAEAIVPWFDNEWGSLESQLAVRHEDYDTGFDSTDPRIALLYQSPNRKFAIRGSFQTAFRAPTLFQESFQLTQAGALFDPLLDVGGSIAQTARNREGLQPEEADEYKIGITLEPWRGFSLSLDYWDIEYTDRIVQESGAELVAEEGRALLRAGCTVADLSSDEACMALRNPEIIRGLDGGVSRVFVDRFNAASLDTDGVDLSINYRIDTPIGMFQIGNQTTYVSNFTLQAAEGEATIEGAGKRNEGTVLARAIPEWKSNTTLGWSRGNHNVNLVARYIDDIPESTVDHTVDEWLVLDLQYSYRLNLFEDQEVQFTVGSLNLTDDDPPAVVGAPPTVGFDPTVHDPRGRMLYVRLNYQM